MVPSLGRKEGLRSWWERKRSLPRKRVKKKEKKRKHDVCPFLWRNPGRSEKILQMEKMWGGGEWDVLLKKQTERAKR